tara:strand:+ start:2992 stop:3318 length:327 start_codon:yes stop_codon:yes gene_type:complete
MDRKQAYAVVDLGDKPKRMSYDEAVSILKDIGFSVQEAEDAITVTGTDNEGRDFGQYFQDMGIHFYKIDFSEKPPKKEFTLKGKRLKEGLSDCLVTAFREYEKIEKAD